MATTADSTAVNGKFTLGAVNASVATGAAGNVTLVNTGTVLTGDLKSSTDIVVAGSIEGEVTCEGRLTIASSGSIVGRIVANDIVIEGQLRGNSVARSTLAILKSARVEGDVTTSSIRIEPGAIFVGKCAMEDSSR